MRTLERGERLDHPATGELERFMRGEPSPEERREVVRHLLRGCLQCTRITGRLWALAEPGPRLATAGPPRIRAGGFHGRVEMTEPEIAARSQLGDIARDLESLYFRLLGVQATLPEPPTESVRLLDVDPMDDDTEIRTIIDCVLSDRLVPALRELHDLAAKK
jgi:hypothetical protein